MLSIIIIVSLIYFTVLFLNTLKNKHSIKEYSCELHDWFEFKDENSNKTILICKNCCKIIE